MQSLELTTQTPQITDPPTTVGQGAGPVAPRTTFSDIQKKQVNKFNKCNNNGGVLGIYQTATDFYFVCTTSPNDVPLVAQNPASSCSTDAKTCVNTECADGMYFLGYDQNGPVGPCWSISSSTATVDRNNCHEQSETQGLPSIGDGTWVKWRICGGPEYYVVTEAVVIGGKLTSITCCLAHAI